MTASARKLAGIGLIVTLIVSWSLLIVAVAERLIGAHWALQALFFLAAGLAWIAPVKPLLRWMETGRWRR
ncbi:MAG: DUF2842 domain-containing protein [Sphingosinicella sp.]